MRQWLRDNEIAEEASAIAYDQRSKFKLKYPYFWDEKQRLWLVPDVGPAPVDHVALRRQARAASAATAAAAPDYRMPPLRIPIPKKPRKPRVLEGSSAGPPAYHGGWSGVQTMTGRVGLGIPYR